MPPFEGPNPNLSVGERAAAQNKKAAEEQSKRIVQGLIAGINNRYKNDPEMRKQKLKELRKELKKQQSEDDEFLNHLRSLPTVPPRPRRRYKRRSIPIIPRKPDPQNMAPRIEKGVLTRGAARGGKIKKTYARGGGIRKPKGF